MLLAVDHIILNINKFINIFNKSLKKLKTMNIIINFNLKPLNQTIVNNEETIIINKYD